MRFLVWTLPEHLDIKLVLPAGTDYELQGIYFDTDESDVEVHRKFQVLARLRQALVDEAAS